MPETIGMLFLLAMPLIVLDFGMRIYAIVDMHKPERKLKHLNKTVWILLVALFSFAWVVYLLIGRGHDVIED